MNDYAMDFSEAYEKHVKLFWDHFNWQLEGSSGSSPDDQRRVFMKKTLDFMNHAVKQMKDGSFHYNIFRWTGLDIPFIITFNPYFEYFDEDDDPENKELTESCLDEEGSFCYKVEKAMEEFILEGAARAKRIDSPSYPLWTEALVNLDDEVSQDKVLPVVNKALRQLWADLRVWIHMNPPKSARKTKKIALKA